MLVLHVLKLQCWPQKCQTDKHINYEQFTGDKSGTDQWMLSRLAVLVESCDKGFRSYDLNNVTQALLDFWWSELCDVYIVSESKFDIHTHTLQCIYSVAVCLNTCSLRAFASIHLQRS